VFVGNVISRVLWELLKPKMVKETSTVRKVAGEYMAGCS
jgi:hypothetical protein